MATGNLRFAVLAAALVVAVTSSPISARYEPHNGIIFLGATDNKELYISDALVTADFTQSLAIECPYRFEMSLAAIETPEEVAIIDSYFEVTQGNSSDAVWTSAVTRIGAVPAHWANNGKQIGDYPAVITGPWPAGAGSSPSYARFNCVTIQRVCNRSQGAPIGCFPVRTQFNYDVCDVQHRYICEKRI